MKYNLTITSPLDQFEIRDLVSLDAPILGNIHLSITNIGLYLTIGAFFAFSFKLFSSYKKVGSNSWSVGQESLYDTVHSIVVNQINKKNGQVYFPFIYALFMFILVNNLIGMVSQCLCIVIYARYMSMFPNFSLASPTYSRKLRKPVKRLDIILLHLLRVRLLILLILTLLPDFQTVKDVFLYLSIKIVEC